MAHFRKLPSGKWRAEVAMDGLRASATRETKAEARSWAAREEAALQAAGHGKFPRKTVAQGLQRYAEEVSPKKRGKRWEMLRLLAIERDFPRLAAKVVSEVNAADISAWRDARLAKVSPGTVLREKNLLSNVFQIAAKEWRWRDGTPFAGVAAPRDNPARTRRIGWREVRVICRKLGYHGRVETKMQETAYAFLVALRTGMRMGEILSLSDATVDLDRAVARVPHKMQHLTGQLRAVPLFPAAVRLLRRMSGRGRYFTVTAQSLETLFRRARDSALIENLHFHDSRAEALTQFARKVDVMTLARLSGHRDLRILYEAYYRESAEDIAGRLKGKP